jgi:hypothetical protein
LTAFLARLSRHPEQDAAAQLQQAFEELQKKLRNVQRTVRACLAPANAPRPRRRTRSMPPSGGAPDRATSRPLRHVWRQPGGADPDAPRVPQLEPQDRHPLVRTKSESFTLEIVDGDVVHAVSDHPPEEQRLGNILVQRGAIDQETLESFLQRYAATTIKVGEALERESLVDEEEMRDALRQQVQQLFHRCSLRRPPRSTSIAAKPRCRTCASG